MHLRPEPQVVSNGHHSNFPDQVVAIVAVLRRVPMVHSQLLR